MSNQNHDTESQGKVNDADKKQITLEELENVSGGLPVSGAKGKYCDSGGYCEEAET